MKHFLYSRIAVVIALVATSLVLGWAAGAAAGTYPDDRAAHSPSAISAQRATDLAHPDDRATHGPGSITRIAPIAAQPSAAGSFDWLDAGIGAAATVVGLGLLAGGASVLVVRHRRSAALS
jgi:hypothetical protein